MFAAHYPHPGPAYGYPPPARYGAPVAGYPGYPPPHYGAPPAHHHPQYPPPQPVAAGPPHGCEAVGGYADFSQERPEIYQAFERMAVRSTEQGVNICLPDKMCLDRHVPDFLRCLECWLRRSYGDPQVTGRRWRLRSLDLSGNDLSDECACSVFDALKRLDVRVDRLGLAQNCLQARALGVLTEYVWACEEAISELDLENNEIVADASNSDGSDPVSALLRCFYNHPAYPKAGSHERKAKAIPVCVKLKGNRITKAKRVLKHIQAKGGKEHVRICKDAEPYSAGNEYLALFAPEIAVQRDGKALPADVPEQQQPQSQPQPQPQALTGAPAEAPAAGGRRSRSRRRRKADSTKTADKTAPGAGKRSRSRDASREPSAASGQAPAAADGGAGAPAANGGAAPLPWLLPADFGQEAQKELEREVYERLGSCEGMTQGVAQEEGARGMLAEFTVCMVQARKGLEDFGQELELFLGAEAPTVLEWLTGHLKAKYGSAETSSKDVGEKAKEKKEKKEKKRKKDGETSKRASDGESPAATAFQ
eukprot:TRINITY_DN1487_c0_g1_i1.p1 TRINITY_DN1487_c0_g1~~TRINITY_DN1487_c0_g1_i1.p1  ORF type:complete len:536 (-),score=142.59 TRINITY_DN1487_c0_g1_i1:46-1653(-)